MQWCKPNQESFRVITTLALVLIINTKEALRLVINFSYNLVFIADKTEIGCLYSQYSNRFIWAMQYIYVSFQLLDWHQDRQVAETGVSSRRKPLINYKHKF